MAKNRVEKKETLHHFFLTVEKESGIKSLMTERGATSPVNLKKKESPFTFFLTVEKESGIKGS